MIVYLIGASIWQRCLICRSFVRLGHRFSWRRRWLLLLLMVMWLGDRVQCHAWGRLDQDSRRSSIAWVHVVEPNSDCRRICCQRWLVMHWHWQWIVHLLACIYSSDRLIVALLRHVLIDIRKWSIDDSTTFRSSIARTGNEYLRPSYRALICILTIARVVLRLSSIALVSMHCQT